MRPSLSAARTLTALVVRLAGAPTVAAAQVSCSASPSCAATHTISLTVPRVARLTLRSGNTTLAVPPHGSSPAPPARSTGPTITVIANRVFSLTVRTTAANWTRPAGAVKTASRLAFAFNGGAPVAMSTTARTLVTGGTRGTHTYPSAFTIAFNPATDRPGAYSIRTHFTLSTP